jgi:hypothetical protein
MAMTDDTGDPRDVTTPVPTARDSQDTVPGHAIDMCGFESAFAGPSAAGPTTEWAIVWAEGRTMIVHSEDAALLLARHNPTCRVVRRWVGPWQRRSGPDS